MMRPIAILFLLACFSACFLMTSLRTIGGIKGFGRGGWDDEQRGRRVAFSSPVSREREDDDGTTGDEGEFEDEFALCGRTAGAEPAASDATSPLHMQRKYAPSSCRDFDPRVPTLILHGHQSYGRTGNQLQAFLQAVQYARDTHDGNVRHQLGITYDSWAMDVITPMFMVRGDPDHWVPRFEEAFCVKVFRSEEEMTGWNRIHDRREEYVAQRLYSYRSSSPHEEYAASQQYNLRTLFRNINLGGGGGKGGDDGDGGGGGRDIRGNAVGDMCSAIDLIFGPADRRGGDFKYSVVHLRYLERDAGYWFLGLVSADTGCDPVAALEMWPDYVKSILEPLGMLDHPVVIITDDQNKVALSVLLSDPDIGPLLRVVPVGSTWVGGDITLAVAADVFIGNPASTFSQFIARSRVALGFGSNYLYRAMDEGGGWVNTCGDECLFRLAQTIYFSEGFPQSGTWSKEELERRAGPWRTRVEAAKNRTYVRTGYTGLHRDGLGGTSDNSTHTDSKFTELQHDGPKRKVYTGLHPGELRNFIQNRQPAPQ